jgi:alanyl-tRNA synthetase
MITSAEIRQRFLDYFRGKGHSVVASSSLVPGNDPTLLFANAGMVQFKDVFIGSEKRGYSRATSAQKCMRVSGKHNDLENVGPSPRHHTFFEMLGNFSFGDYFKREAITFAWEFLTQVMGLDEERLFPTVFLDDDEASELWQKLTGMPASRITRLGKKDNFWAMGDTGPNGPCSEIIYDRGEQYCTCQRSDCGPAIECERWWELWNLVFMQFDTRADGTTVPLPKPSIDTGMGMERLTAIMQRKDDNYETDLFWPIIQRTQSLLGHADEERQQQLVSYRVIADHARATAFLIGDGVLPGNEGRNYVLRLVLRRAARHGRMLGFREPFIAEVLRVVMDIMGQHYSTLEEQREFILQAATQEEERFLQTLDVGLSLLDTVIAEVTEAGGTVIPGEDAFRLYDTYGFPLDLTRDVAKEHGLTIDEARFLEEMKAQRERARAAQRFETTQEGELYRSLNLAQTRFLGYDTLTATARILAIVADGQAEKKVSAGQEVAIVLDRTPFYGEAGGQIGDRGLIIGPHGEAEVLDTRHPVPDLTVHHARLVEGHLSLDELVEACVDEERRLDIARNHTATHLLHHALQRVLGEHARQAGSLVAPERLRFDFTHLQPVSGKELRQVEREVNAAIRANMPVQADVTSFDEAQSAGATALFGEKYGDRVRMISMGDDFSRELCGGTHLDRTGQIGFFQIVNESSIGSGLRRIEAVTGRGAEAYVQQQLDRLAEAAAILHTQPGDLVQSVKELTDQLRERQRQIERLQSRAAHDTISQLVSQTRDTLGVQVLAAEVQADSVDRLRQMIDQLRQQLGSAVIVLAAVTDGKPSIVAAVTKDLVERGLHAGRLVGQIAQVVGGGGGGRPTMAQAGGHDASKLGEALAQVGTQVESQLRADNPSLP